MEHRLDTTETMERWGIRFTGIVQGVGFRPLVSVLADQLGLQGFVYNDGDGAYVEAQGPESALQLFVNSIHSEQPRLCRITSCDIQKLKPVEEKSGGFIIDSSHITGPVRTFISADTSPCEACLKEMNDPSGRRYGYPFINCTDCGPRYSIIEAMPYDRERTTMGDFSMCADCDREYRDINGRRYHAEPNACACCGPSYTLLDGAGRVIADRDIFAFVRNRIAEGAVVAVKGIGGYHLVCDATVDKAVQTLRERKQRYHKPLAVMAGSLEAVESVAVITDAALEALTSMVRPIVLMERLREPKRCISSHVAPHNYMIGLMLPYAPVHSVLVPEDALWVMTSGNKSGQSILYDDKNAVRKLSGVADYFLVHNRKICAPVDDSVVTATDRTTLLIRRSRGFVPEPIHCTLQDDISVLAMGGDLKNAFAINRGTEALMGPHTGDLQNESVHRTLEDTIAHYQSLFAVKPDCIAVDSHPSYFSSSLGRQLGEELHVPVISLQHHHSHIASVMAEHDLRNPVLGICFDGTGYGDDGTMWGGEFMICHDTSYKRVVHMHEAPLPGGEKAVMEPWRQALWYIRDYYGQDVPDVYRRWMAELPEGWEILDASLRSDMPMTYSTGAGRLFDTIGCLLGLGNVHTYDAQVATALEALAGHERGGLLNYQYDGHILDFRPVVRDIMDGVVKGRNRAVLAASFHKTLAIALCEVSADICERYQLDTVAVSGGVFQNRRLVNLMEHMWHQGTMYMNEKVPCNDGGIALGQLWLAHRYITGNLKSSAL